MLARNVLDDFVVAFIDFPKPLVGVINGPTVGIGQNIQVNIATNKRLGTFILFVITQVTENLNWCDMIGAKAFQQLTKYSEKKILFMK